MYYLKNSKLGMTLIEMVISLVVLGILMTSTMGMIISSNNIFLSTSKAALDRQIGNHIFDYLESVTKYSTHMKIVDATSDVDSGYGQAFALRNADDEEEIGYVQYYKTDKYYTIKTVNGKETQAPKDLYESSFYNGRTVRYKFEPVSNKHVKISVTVFRDGKDRYTRTATIKCVNLGTLSSGVNRNTIDSTGLTKDASGNVVGYNQTVYFTCDEMLLSGGEEAWTLEYKVQEYMDGYNAILNAYTSDLQAAQKNLQEIVASTSGGSTSVNKATFDTANSARNKAFFGVNSLTNAVGNIVNYNSSKTLAENKALCSKNGVDGATIDNNLRLYYQCMIYDYLGYSPLATKDYGSDVPATISSGGNTYPNPYYGVAVTKEQLYTGFLFKNYKKNPNNSSIPVEELPRFSEDGFFAGSIFETDGFDEEMVILSYFIEAASKGIIGNSSKPLATVATSNTPCYSTVGYKYNDTWVSWDWYVQKRFGNDASKAVSDGLSVGTLNDNHTETVTTEISPAEGETPAVTETKTVRYAYSIRNNDSDSFVSAADWMKYSFDDSLEGAEFLASMREGKNLGASGKEFDTTWTKVQTKLNPIDISTCATKVSKATDRVLSDYNFFAGGEQINQVTFKANKDIQEGWYYYNYSRVSTSGRVQGYMIFYLAAPTGDNNSQGSMIAVRNEALIDIYHNNLSFTSPGKTGYRYQQARYSVDASAAGQNTNFSIPTCIYTLNGHNYQDFILYAVDDGYWFTSPSRGLLNKAINNAVSTAVKWVTVIDGVVSTITGNDANPQQDYVITSINASNANKVLGNYSSLTFSDMKPYSRSYNTAWVVYNSTRGTWYYLPAESSRISTLLSGSSRYSSTDTPTSLDLESWGSSTAMNADINNRKLTNKLLFGTKDPKDVIWVALPCTADDLLD